MREHKGQWMCGYGTERKPDREPLGNTWSHRGPIMEHTMSRIDRIVQRTRENTRMGGNVWRIYEEIHDWTHGVMHKRRQPTDNVGWQKSLG